jgi:4-amino-4-deoxy-L-arabinose transferase-like glycosyltransferase
VRLPQGWLAGRGEVARTALLVGVPLLLVLIVWACSPRPYYTGTNSIRTRDFVQAVKGGETLCVRDLQLPAETGLVELQLVMGEPRPALRLDVRTPGGALIATSRVAGEDGAGPYRRDAVQDKVAFAIAQRPEQPRAVPASVCLTPRRVVKLGGTLAIGGVAPTLDGKEVGDARVGVWFRPPAGAERSLVSQIPTMFERATLFRPPWVGRWTYWLLLGLVLPAAFALALVLLIRAGSLPARKLAAGVFAVAAAITLSWSLITPPFQAPDEQDHFAYAQQLAENGKAASQDPGLAEWSTSLTVALQSVRALAANEQADGRPPWLRHDEHEWKLRGGAGASRKDGGGPTTAATHGPVYYGVMTVPYRLAGGASIWSQLELMRIFSGLLAALTVLLVFLAAREVVPRRPLFAVGAALLVALNPMFTFIGASVNNDVGVNAAAALFLFLLLRATRRGFSIPLALALGATLGVLPVIKGTSYALYVVAAVALLALLLAQRNRKVVVGVVVTLAALVVVQVFWSSVAAGFGRTTFTTPGGGAPVTSAGLWDTAGVSLGYLWQIFLPVLPSMYDHYPLHEWPAYTIYVVRGWGSFGWYAIDFPAIVYETIVAGTVLTLACAAWFARRRWAWLKANQVMVVTLIATPILVIAAVERAFATAGQRTVIAEMGRYAFPAIGALAILAAGAWGAFGERWGVRITTAVVVTLMVFTYASQLLTLGGFYT